MGLKKMWILKIEKNGYPGHLKLQEK